jgi:uncharacterized membrane protein (TIGR02234 family)
MAEESRRRGARFAPVVLAGLATAALTSVASAKPWFRLDVPARLAVGPESGRSGDMPLALALSLVVLAGWGAVLVSRGRVRRVCASIALLASVGVLVCVATAPTVIPDSLRSNAGLSASTDASVTGWYLTAALSDVLALGVLVLAWLHAPRWPTMSSRYDAPTHATSGGRSSEPAQLWKALDEGVDPTDPDDASD